jgi:hypothetical protein
MTDHTQTLVTHFLSREDLRKIRAQLGAQHWLYQRLFRAWKRARSARRLLRGKTEQNVSGYETNTVVSDVSVVDECLTAG